MLVFWLCGGLKLMMFLFCRLLLLAVFIFAWYLRLCLYPDLSKASWYGVTEFLKISSEENNDESQDSIKSRSCLMIDSGWLDSKLMYFICFLFGKGDK